MLVVGRQKRVAGSALREARDAHMFRGARCADEISEDEISDAESSDSEDEIFPIRGNE